MILIITLVIGLVVLITLYNSKKTCGHKQGASYIVNIKVEGETQPK